MRINCFLITFILVTLNSCYSSNDVNSEKYVKSPSEIKDIAHLHPIPLDAIDYSDSINYTDNQGLRQGVWEERGWKNKLISRVFYIDDIENGPYIISDGYYKVGNYNQGKKHGVERWTYTLEVPDNDLVVLMFDNDSILWQAHPAADAGQLIPTKGIRLFNDSVLVNIPFSNGVIWYKGLYINKQPKGIHKIFYPNGELQGWVNYELLQAESFDSLGNFVRQDTVFKFKNNYALKFR